MAFATTAEAFSLGRLSALLQANDVDGAKAYVLAYFAPTVSPPGVFFWRAETRTFQHLTHSEVKALYIKKGMAAVRLEGRKAVSWSVSSWFFDELTDVYAVACEPGRQRTFERGGQSYVNLFAGYLHEAPRLWAEFDDETRANVGVVRAHIRDVLAGGMKEQANYLERWIAGVCAGRKMRTMIYLRSGQGTGKSTLPEFLAEAVLGVPVVHTTSDPQTVLGTFNGELLGKVLLVLEEMPTASKGDFMNLADRLKNIGIESIRRRIGTDRPAWIEVNFAELKKAFTAKGWIHQTDEVPEAERCPLDDVYDDSTEVDDEPAAVDDEPTTVAPEPATIDDEPTAAPEPIAVVSEPSVASAVDFDDLLAEIFGDEPTAAPEPATVAPEPAPVDDEPATGDDVDYAYLMAEILADRDG